MKYLAIALLFIIPLAFANLYGPATMSFEKTWTINGMKNTKIELDGIFIINNTYQTVSSIELSEGAYLIYEKEGAIKVGYTGTMTDSKKEITATAIVNVFYNPSLPSDSYFEITGIPAEDYIKYNDEISAKAVELADTSSAYTTIKELTEWTNKYITYDIGYFGENVPAEQTFVERRGVCVEYSNLLISMFRSLGFDTKYVSGYVYGTEWQPHAWVKVLVGSTWIPLDPTFGEAGYLDNSHIMMYRGKDQSEIVDKINSNKKLEFETSESIEVISSSKSNTKLVDLNYDYDEPGERIVVTLKNRKNEPIFFSYDIAIPVDAGKGERKIMFLEQKETKKMAYPINPGYLQPGFVYNIPIITMINDQETKYDLVISKENTGGGKSSCPLAFIILAVSSISIIRRR